MASPIDVSASVTIARPRAQVARFMFDPANDAAWTEAVIACRTLTDGPYGPGTRVERTVRFLGRTFSYAYEVRSVDPDRAVELSVANPFPMRVRYQLDDAEGGGTRATIRAQGDPGRFFRLMGPLLARMVRRNIGRDLALLERCVEQP